MTGPRVNVKVERGSNFTFTRDVPTLPPFFFTRLKSTCMCTHIKIKRQWKSTLKCKHLCHWEIVDLTNIIN